MGKRKATTTSPGNQPQPLSPAHQDADDAHRGADGHDDDRRWHCREAAFNHGQGGNGRPARQVVEDVTDLDSLPFEDAEGLPHDAD